MDLESIRSFVREHPEGVRLRMVDGREFDIPHRDYVTFGPPRDTPVSRRGAHATSFLLWVEDDFRLINALLVAEMVPLKANGNGHAAGESGGGEAGQN